MLKISVFLLVFIMFFTFSSCGKQNSNDFVKNRKYTIDDIKIAEGFEIKTEKDAYKANVDVINYTIINNTNESTFFSDEIKLSKCIDGEWKIVSFDKDVFVEDLAFLLRKKSTDSETFILEEYFDFPLEPGQYRLVKPGFARSNIFIIE